MTEITIPANDAYKQTTASGGETNIPFDFPIFAKADLVLLRTRSGTTTTLVLDTDYTIADNQLEVQAGGNAVLAGAASPATAADVYTAYRAVSEARLTDYTQAGAFKAATINRDLDLVVMMAQQLRRDVDRKIGLAPQTSGSGVSLLLPTPSASKLLRWNSGATGLENYDIAGLASAPVSSAWDDIVASATLIAGLDLILDGAIGSTRGMMLARGASGWQSLAVGAANTIKASDGTDVVNATLSALIDSALGSTRGSVLYRGASGWAILSPGTSGHALKSGGPGADPSYGAVSSGLTLIQAQTPSAVAALDFTGLSSTYDTYLLAGHLIPASDDVQLWLRLDSNGGASFDAGASDYQHGSDGRYGGTSAGPAGSTGDTKIILTPDPGAGFGVGNGATEGVSFEIWIRRHADAAAYTLVSGGGVVIAASPTAGFFSFGGARFAAQADDAVRLLFESGNITSGYAVLYGLQKS